MADEKKLAHGHREDYYLLSNARLIMDVSPKLRNMENWILAKKLFATGSTSAYQICRDAGIDPEAKTISRR